MYWPQQQDSGCLGPTGTGPPSGLRPSRSLWGPESCWAAWECGCRWRERREENFWLQEEGRQTHICINILVTRFKGCIQTIFNYWSVVLFTECQKIVQSVLWRCRRAHEVTPPHLPGPGPSVQRCLSPPPGHTRSVWRCSVQPEDPSPWQPPGPLPPALTLEDRCKNMSEITQVSRSCDEPRISD